MTNARVVQEWEARFREAAQAGRPPDALRHHSRDESERFWARVVPGSDGHCYWTGGKEFQRNGGTGMQPARWAWINAHGPIKSRVSVYPTCGERNCVTVAHLEAEPRDRRQWSDESLIGAGQVATIRRGRPPSIKWWERNVRSPNRKTIIRRFGTWARFLDAIRPPR